MNARLNNSVNADCVIAGPGDLFTSTLANVIVAGIAPAIAKSAAKFIFINIRHS